MKRLRSGRGPSVQAQGTSGPSPARTGVALGTAQSGSASATSSSTAPELRASPPRSITEVEEGPASEEALAPEDAVAELLGGERPEEAPAPEVAGAAPQGAEVATPGEGQAQPAPEVITAESSGGERVDHGAEQGGDAPDASGDGAGAARAMGAVITPQEAPQEQAPPVAGTLGLEVSPVGGEFQRAAALPLGQPAAVSMGVSPQVLGGTSSAAPRASDRPSTSSSVPSAPGPVARAFNEVAEVSWARALLLVRSVFFFGPRS